ncbi:hypothetical protein [Nocardia sp. NPDC046763]|uniref:hypothetical protein n=1 Tax=Nocardia sp. NPDC046763 TaxID=3155256 RepID=UPI0033D23C15
MTETLLTLGARLYVLGGLGWCAYVGMSIAAQHLAPNAPADRPDEHEDQADETDLVGRDYCPRSRTRNQLGA